ncbi:hypothetical protein Bca4012_033480 [Brassica carinata]
MSPLPNTAQIISELEYELEGSINVCPWLGTTSALLPTPRSLSLTLLSIMPPAKADTSALYEVINRASDGGITPLHVAALPRTVHVIEEGPREQRNQLFSVLGSLTDPEEEESKESSEVASVDIKLPRRRSLQVEFSCNSYGERRTKRLINRLAYERGLVFVQFSKRVLPRSEMVMVLETCPGNLLELEEMKGLEELVLELGHGAGAGGRVIGVSARGGEAGGGEVAGGGDAGWGEAGASGGETVEAGTRGLCGGCGGGATGLITGATFGAGGGETVGVTAGGGVVRDAGGRVAETGGTTVVGGVA